jgi:methylglyoxal synthase
VRAGRDGGDFQIAQFVVGRRMLAVIFLIDPVATNIVTAAAVLNSLAMLEASLTDRAALEVKSRTSKQQVGWEPAGRLSG